MFRSHGINFEVVKHKQLLLQANSVAKSSLFGAIEMEVLEGGNNRISVWMPKDTCEFSNGANFLKQNETRMTKK